jgi:hypothetical protein
MYWGNLVDNVRQPDKSPKKTSSISTLKAFKDRRLKSGKKTVKFGKVFRGLSYPKITPLPYLLS